jgi:CheY-like chemotaxis protein
MITPLKLLIVDDHPDIREMLATSFKWRGHLVDVAGSIADALALPSEKTFDLVISDWSLPDGTGGDLLKQLQARRPIKGIVLSAYTQGQIGEKSRAAGFSRVIDKFSNLETIVDAVEAVAAGQ